MYKKLYLFFVSVLVSTPVLANGASAGDTSWLLTSTALVLVLAIKIKNIVRFVSHKLRKK